MEKKRLALVNQRYGTEVNGGSEYYTRMLAQRLAPFYDIEVITTCAKDYDTWENFYEPGECTVDGIKVRRFPVKKTRKQMGFLWLNRIRHYMPPVGRMIEQQWVAAQGPYSPACVEYLKNCTGKYDCFIFVTYLYYLTVHGMKAADGRKILIPTAHDEEYIYMNIYRDMFCEADGIIYLTEEEKRFVEKKFNNVSVRNIVAGMGIEVPQTVKPEKFREQFQIDSDYIIYVGRIEEGKGCGQLLEFYREYSQRNKKLLKLVLVGKNTMKNPVDDDIITTGFVSEEDKYNAIAGAAALILPSEHESLSISVLEAMALGVPVLVNKKSAVLTAHCEKSGAGYAYQSCDEFIERLDELMQDSMLRSDMGKKGKRYIEQYYDWQTILTQIRSLIDGRNELR